jgi:hypothetical protein
MGGKNSGRKKLIGGFKPQRANIARAGNYIELPNFSGLKHAVSQESTKLTIDDLYDVDDTNKANDRVLVYNSTTGNMEYEDQSGGGGGADIDDGTETGQMIYWIQSNNGIESGWYLTDINKIIWDYENSRLGINTPTPQQPLHVSGGAFITGNLSGANIYSNGLISGANIYSNGLVSGANIYGTTLISGGIIYTSTDHAVSGASVVNVAYGTTDPNIAASSVPHGTLWIKYAE